MTTPWFNQRDPRWPVWVPVAQTVSVACGEYFDAVRVRADDGERALAVLGAAGTGPVLANFSTRTWYFLLDPGTATRETWTVPATRLLRPGTRISIPPAHITYDRDVRWASTPRGSTNPGHLTLALTGQPIPAPQRRRAAPSRNGS